MGWWYKIGFWRWVVSGFLMGAGFMVPLAWPLGLLGVVVFLAVCQQTTASPREYVGAWMAWSIKAGMALWWFWATYPIAWLPEDLGKIQLLLIGGGWATSALSLGVGGVLVYGLIQKVRKHAHLHALLFDGLIPVIWVLGELVGSLSFSLVEIGPGGSITTAFSFSYVGYLLAMVPGMLVLAKAAGVYGLSYFFVVLAVVLMRAVQKSKYRFWLTAVLALVVLGACTAIQKTFFVNTSLNPERHNIIIIDTKFSPELLRDRAGSQLVAAETTQAMMAALAKKPDFIILPEDARFFDQTVSAKYARDSFAEQYHQTDTVIIDTGRATIDEETLLQSFIYAGPDDPIGQVHKRYLVPQGEFISYWLAGLLRLFGYEPLVQKVMEGMSYRVGDRIDQSVLVPQVPAILFCFESVDPLGVRRVVTEHSEAPFIAHPISHSWFHTPVQLWRQLDVMLRIQAVWNGRYVISAGSNAEGKLYTPDGKIISPETVAEDVYWRVREVTIE